MSRILYIASDFYPSTGGYANGCTSFVLSLMEKTGVSVDVITFAPLSNAEELNYERLSVSRIRLPWPLGGLKPFSFDLLLAYHILRQAGRKRYDAIFFETAEYPLAGLLTAYLVKDRPRVMVRIHACSETEWVLFRQQYLYLAKKWPTILFFRKVRFILSTTSYYIDFARHHFFNDNALLIASKHYFVLPNIVRQRPDRGPAPGPGIEPLFEPGDNIVFFTLGRMDFFGELQKNFIRLFIGLSLLKDKPYFARIVLAIVGTGEMRGYYEGLAERLGIKSAVRFHDYLSNGAFNDLQRRCHGVILASTFEGMSMFALEGMANGAPLLFSSSGGLSELVDDRKNGILFDPFDVDDIAEKLDYYITDMLPDIESVRANSRNKYERCFSADLTAGRFLKILDIIEKI